MSEPRSLALPADLAGLVPFTYAYRYAHNDSFVIRFSHGQEINGGRPVEAIPLYKEYRLCGEWFSLAPAIILCIRDYSRERDAAA